MLFCGACGGECVELSEDDKARMKVVTMACEIIAFSQDMPAEITSSIPGFEVMVRSCEHVLAGLGWLEPDLP